jgi:hypothetical protein
MKHQHFKGPCDTRVTVWGPDYDGGFLIIQLPLSKELNVIMPNIRQARVKTVDQANRTLRSWKATSELEVAA